MSKIKAISVGLFCLVLSSCGLIDIEFDPATNQVLSLTFEYDTVYVMERDTFFLAPYLYPDSLASASIYWQTENAKVVKCQNDTILASGQGWSRVFATTLINNRSDTCTVFVMPRWEVSEYEYPYDMAIYAHILIDGKVPPKNWKFGSFDEDGEPRGMAKAMNDDRTIYRFRVWSNVAPLDSVDVEKIFLKAYNPTTLQMYSFKTSTYFNGASQGTPSNPLQLSIIVNDEE